MAVPPPPLDPTPTAALPAAHGAPLPGNHTADLTAPPPALRTIQQTGSSANRVDMIFLGDGYTAGEIATTYTTHVNNYVNYIFNGTALTDPFTRYRNFFNIHVVDVISNQSGADNPGAGITRDTALGASYYWDGVTERLLYVNDTLANNAMNSALAGTGIGAEMRYVTVNDTKYGGGGGTFAVYAGGNSFALEVALHEVGHSFAHLADEYGGNTATYTGAEPSEVNVTKNSTGAKWSNWLGYVDPVLGTVGAYNGGRYYDSGIYRPTSNSKMRSLDRPFDPIGREAFIRQFYQFVDPLDGYDSNVGTRANLQTLNVDSIDPAIISVDWTVNGSTFANAGESFSLNANNFTFGTYTVTARAYDPTPWVRGSRTELEQTVVWTVANDYRLTGTSAGETLTGTANAQSISGLGGNDTLLGLGADDGLDGGAGLDKLLGGTGADTLTGGTESDLFYFAASDFQSGVADTITDLAASGDLLRLDAVQYYQVAASNVGGAPRLSVPGGAVINVNATGTSAIVVATSPTTADPLTIDAASRANLQLSWHDWAATQNYSRYTEIYNSAGIKNRQFGAYDTGAGGSWDFLYDVTNSNAAYQQRLDYFNASGQQTEQQGTYDGTAGSWIQRWDRAGTEGYDNTITYYNQSAQPTQVQSFYDASAGGGSGITTFDPTGTASYSNYTTYYDTHGHADTLNGVYDVGPNATWFVDFYQDAPADARDFLTVLYNGAGAVTQQWITMDNGTILNL